MICKTVLIQYDFELPRGLLPKFRGAISYKIDCDLVHNHKENGEVIYRYPQVQFKTIDKKASVLLINPTSTLFSKFFNLAYITMLGRIYSLREKNITESSVKIYERKTTYCFESPWMALNQENHSTRKKLEQILIGNVISFCKGVGYNVAHRLEAKVFSDKTIPVKLKGMTMQGFLGKFKINISLPDFVGIGKQSSRGFGVIRRAF